MSRTADYDPSPVIHGCLQRGVTGKTRYRDPSSAPMREPQTLRVSRTQRAAILKRAHKSDPTRRCPCGSGKMFKNCCLKKPR